MYNFTVDIPDPMLIQRHFQCVDTAKANQFIVWLKEQGLTYRVTYTPAADVYDALADA